MGPRRRSVGIGKWPFSAGHEVWACSSVYSTMIIVLVPVRGKSRRNALSNVRGA